MFRKSALVFTFFSLAILKPSFVIAQGEKKIIDIEQCFQRAYMPQMPEAIQWQSANTFTQTIKDTCWAFNLNSNGTLLGKKMLFTKDSFIKRTMVAVSATTADKSFKLARIPQIHWESSSTGWFAVNDYYFNINLNAAQTDNLMLGWISLKAYLNIPVQEIQAQEISENGNWLAYVKSNNIYVTSIHGDLASKSINAQVTTDGSENLVYGQSVHQNEFGITKGLFWSKNAKKLAFYRMDQTRVTSCPLVNIGDRPASSSSFKYPMAGDSSHTVTVGIFDPMSLKTIYLKTEGTYDHYLTNLTWTPDEKFLYISWVNREQNKMELRKYSVESGLLVSIDFVMTHPKYVEPETGPVFLPNSNTDFVLEHKGSGYNHLYLFQFPVANLKKGKSAGMPVISSITAGNWEVTQLLGFSTDGTQIIYQGTGESPMERHIYSSFMAAAILQNTSLKKGLLLTKGYAGTHNAIYHKESHKILDFYSSVTVPMTVSIFNIPKLKPGISIQENFRTHVIFESPNPLSNFNLGEVKLEKQNFNGVELYSRTFLPFNFDPNKKYPVVVYVYGGPHAQMVTNSWLGGGSLWMHYMASKGYIVYTIDNRGSAHRGLEFENATHRQLGTVEMQDQLAALKWLKNQSWVDSTRVGIHGWSFGGFMTTSLMIRAAGNYKVGVAGGPVINWKYYEIMYTERYMDKPQENPDGYAANNLLDYSKNLKGKLLMIHGADDNVVVWQHSLMFVERNVKDHNVNLDYFVYPGHKHNVVGPDRAHLYKKVCQYFFDFL